MRPWTSAFFDQLTRKKAFRVALSSSPDSSFVCNRNHFKGAFHEVLTQVFAYVVVPARSIFDVVASFLTDAPHLHRRFARICASASSTG